MKCRKFFVSNSSSSSFVCEICGDTESVYDGASLSDYGYVRCSAGHGMCEEHILANDGEEQYSEDYELLPEFCPICQFQVYSESELKKYLIKTRDIDPATVFEEVKKVNKRRKKLYDAEYIKYCFDKFELNEDMMLAELKSKFKSHDEYYNFIWNRSN